MSVWFSFLFYNSGSSFLHSYRIQYELYINKQFHGVCTH